MLLSDEPTSAWLSQHFVLSYENVHDPVKVSMDFGNGKTLERTLVGNTAFYVTTSDGTVVDVLPGVYTPEDFRSQVEPALALAQSVARLPAKERLESIRAHHAKAVERIASSERIRTMSAKAFVESPLLSGLGMPGNPVPAASKAPASAFEKYTAKLDDVSKRPSSAAKMRASLLGNTKLEPEERERRVVALDSRTNVTGVRPAVHLLFGTIVSPATPASLRDKVYGSILHIDLSDPYLGLGENTLPGTPAGKG